MEEEEHEGEDEEEVATCWEVVEEHVTKAAAE